MTTDDMIREALNRVADTAADGTRVRAGLARRFRRYRQRRALLMAGGVSAAAAAVGGPTALMLRQRPVEIQAGAPNLAEPAPPPAPTGGNGFVPLRWRPTWLPEGYVEVSRTVTVDGPASGLQLRTWWRQGSADEEEFLHLHAGPPGWFGDQSWRRPARINGAPGGMAHEPGQISQVVWRPTPAEMLAVGLTALAPENLDRAGRVAGSVVPDTVAGCEVPLEFGWLPEGVAGQRRLTIDTDERGDVRVQCDLQPSPGNGMPLVRVTLGTSVYRPGGWEPVTVRDRPGVGRVTVTNPEVAPGAQVPATGPFGWVHVELDDGRQLSVSLELSTMADPPGLSLADVVRVADRLRIGPAPDTGWLGRR